jgi:hypothetical protein
MHLIIWMPGSSSYNSYYCKNQSSHHWHKSFKKQQQQQKQKQHWMWSTALQIGSKENRNLNETAWSKGTFRIRISVQRSKLYSQLTLQRNFNSQSEVGFRYTIRVTIKIIQRYLILKHLQLSYYPFTFIDFNLIFQNKSHCQSPWV